MERAISATEEIKRSAEADVERLSTSPFSQAGFTAFKEKVADYSSDLLAESVKVSKRHSADSVSAAHVAHAADYLVSSRAGRLHRYLGIVGVILLGASFSSFLEMTLLWLPAAHTLVSAGLGVIGAFLLALQIARE